MTSPTSTQMPPLPPLTLIVATTPSLGIGLRGTLPWPPLKADLAFFARVTKRPPARLSPSNSSPPQPSTSPPQLSASSSDNAAATPINAVLMGRRTWDSIPARFRPLRGRANIVVSRNQTLLQSIAQDHAQSPTDPKAQNTAVITASSITDGLRQYQAKGYGGRVFVIGGASIYEETLGMGECVRVLWTRLRQEWECDTWFPRRGFAAEEGEGDWGRNGNGKRGGEKEGEEKEGWKRRGKEELEAWSGEEGVGGVRKEGEVEFEIEMWEREAQKAEGKEAA